MQPQPSGPNTNQSVFLNEFLRIVKFICLVFAIWFSIVNFAKIVKDQDVSAANFVLQAISIAGFIFIQFGL